MTRYVTVSLAGNPNLEDAKDPKRQIIIELCEKVSEFDPEFVLKVRQILFCPSKGGRKGQNKDVCEEGKYDHE